MFNDKHHAGLVNINPPEGLHICNVFLTYSDAKVDISQSSARCTHEDVLVESRQIIPIIRETTQENYDYDEEYYDERAKRQAGTTQSEARRPVCTMAEANTGFTFKLCLDLSPRVVCKEAPCLVHTEITEALIGRGRHFLLYLIIFLRF